MNSKITPEAKKICTALERLYIDLSVEHWDGYKHVDIYIPCARLCIEVDGPRHYTDPHQIMRDIERASYSARSGRRTIHIPNEAIQKNCQGVAKALAQVIRARRKTFSTRRSDS
ncbi:MAG: DUF559 domain-containing protein [Candidatus Pacebacteria bacterium]|nr:DUF559 domain-containing protein [Candidatus Paceibacterota bacterium]